MKGKYPPLRKLTAEEQQLVLANTGLAGEEARKMAWVMAYQSGWKGHGCDKHFFQFYEDLFHAGIIGLCVAAQRYDKTCDNKFCTYAYWIVKGAVQHECNNAFLFVGGKTYGSKRHRLALLCDLDDGCKQDEFRFDVWDGQTDEVDEEERKAQRKELRVLLGFHLDKRRCMAVEMCVFDDMTLAVAGKKLKVGRERVRQLLASSMKKLRRSKGFVQALEKRVKRQRQMETRDFFKVNVGVPEVLRRR